ncbi:hypothetical protein [Lutibacter maritimus]|uniref:Uncharacterized protein n=1 Tax=Lutibacter maritimus TaxID=593133 RepID=A0A1I6QNH7_9FLAO|nr:hypothetical protein [Lutibacter maritimus]SFS53882.1 hypothetical protein SAMN04488006_1940 [Lutibacter maritimus]
MKNLKTLSLLFCLTTFLISCEKDVTEVIDTATLQDTEINQLQNSKISFLNLLKNKQLFSKNSNYTAQKSSKLNSPLLRPSGEAVAQFYLNDEAAFDCSGEMQIEDFSKIETYEDVLEIYDIDGVLDENTILGDEENTYIEQGDIVSGIQFSTSEEYLWFILNSNFEEFFNISFNSAFFNASSAPLEVTFENNNINAITMRLLLENGITTSIYAVDEDGNLLGEIAISPMSEEYEEIIDQMVSIKSTQPIKKLYIIAEESFIYPNFFGFDYITFGECIPDSDNDGILNNVDPYPNSNLSETLFIDEINTSILNKFTKTKGVTMADEMDNLINVINAQYTGDNYNQLHKKFVSEVAKLSYYWYKSRLITSKERSKISSFAWSSNVPSFQQPG